MALLGLELAISRAMQGMQSTLYRPLVGDWVAEWHEGHEGYGKVAQAAS